MSAIVNCLGRQGGHLRYVLDRRKYGLVSFDSAVEDEIYQRIQEQEALVKKSAIEARELIKKEQQRQRKMIARFPFRVNDMIVKSTCIQDLENLYDTKWSKYYDAENIVRSMQKAAIFYRNSKMIATDRYAQLNPDSVPEDKRIAICSKNQVHGFLDRACSYLTITKVKSLQTEQLCNMLWVFTSTGFAHTPRGEESFAYCLQQLSERSGLFKFTSSFNPFSVSLLLWSMAKTNQVNKELVQALCSQAIRKSDKFRGQDVSNVLLSLAKMKHYDEGVFTRFLRQYQPKVIEMNSQQIANILWACQQVRHYDYEFLEELSHYLVEMGLEELIVVFKGATSILHALAVLGHRNMFLLRALQKYTVDARVMFLMDMQGMANCLYAWSVLEQEPERMSEIVNLVNLSFRRHGEKVVNEKDRYQLYFAHLLCKTQSKSIGLDEDLLAVCSQAWIKTRQHTPFGLKGLEQEVAVLLQQMGHAPVHNYYTEDGLVMIRLGIISGDQKICVRVMGDQHFTRNYPRRVLGHVDAWSRLYAMYGWYSVDIPQFEWNKLQNTEQMLDYLRRRLPSEQDAFRKPMKQIA